MTVEAVTYISDLNASNPASGDSLVEGDDHIRNLKTGIKATFPNISGAVTPTHTELNYVDGVTSAIQTQLDAKQAASTTGLVLIATTSPAGAAYGEFTTGLSSTYDEYEIHVIEAVPSVDAATLELVTSTDGGSTYASAAGSYEWTNVRATGTTVTAASGSAGAASSQITICSAGVDSSATWGGCSAVIRLVNPAGSSAYKRLNWEGGLSSDAVAGSTVTFSGSGLRAATADIDAVRLRFSSGNITATLRLYGVKK